MPRFPCVLLCLSLLAPAAAGSDFYVSAVGSDANPGTQAQPWQTIAKVNAAALNAGDSVRFRGGDTFTGTLNITRSGAAGHPITWTSYGTGRAAIATSANNQGAILISNAAGGVSDVTVDGIDLRGTWTLTHSAVASGSYSGITLVGATARVTLQAMDISQFMTNGITLEPDAATSRLGSANLAINHVVLHHNRGDGLWCDENHFSSARLVHSDVHIADAVAHDNYGYGYNFSESGKGSGFGLAFINRGVIERCVAYANGANFTVSGGGPVGIWLNRCSNVVIQHCEAYGNTSQTDDGGGFDIDGGCQNCVVQYSYSHNNRAYGFFFAEWTASAMQPWQENTIRYCVSENDGVGDASAWAGGIRVWGYVYGNGYIYGNTVYGDKTKGTNCLMSIDHLGSGAQVGQRVQAYNNLFIGSGAVLAYYSTGSTGTYANNDFWRSGSGFAAVWGGTTYASLAAWQAATSGAVAHNLNVDPLLVRTADRGTVGSIPTDAALGNALAAYYRIPATSPAVDAGADLALTSIIPAPGPGSADFFGDAIPQHGAFDLGAHEVVFATAPAISAVAPNSGATAGGTTVSITGTNLSGTTAVTFGGAAAGAVTVVSATKVTCTAPPHAAGTVNVALTASAGSTTASGAYSYIGGSGTILREYWSDVTGTAIAQIPVASAPSGSSQLGSFEGPTSWAHNYGARVRGYVFPPTTGSYTFWIAGDDNCELWLSTDATAGAKRLIASVPEWTASRQWTKFPKQTSAAISLVGGQRYYIEALQKQGTGGDNLAVAWSGPGIAQQVIPGQYLSPASAANQPPTVALSNPAGGASFTAPASITIEASAADSDGTVAKVEFFNGSTLLATDTGSPWSFTWTNVAAGTYSLSARATDNGGAVTTSAARSITVQGANGGSGTGLSAIYYDNPDFSGASVSRRDATVNFDWGTGAPATGIGANTFSARWTGQIEVPTAGSWTFTTTSDDGIRLWINGQPVISNWTDHAATSDSGSITLGAGQRYDLKLEFYDNANLAVAKLAWSGPGQATQIIPSSRLYPATALPPPWVGQDIGAMSPAGSSAYSAGSDTFTLTGAGADIWGNTDAFRAVSTDISGNCDFIARVDSLQNTHAWAKAGVMLRNGLAADAQHAMMIISFASGASFQYRSVAGGTSNLATMTGIAAPRWVKLSRRGDVFTGSQSADGQTWIEVGHTTVVMPTALKAALVVTSHLDGTANTATLSQVSLLPVQAN